MGNCKLAYHYISPHTNASEANPIVRIVKCERQWYIIFIYVLYQFSSVSDITFSALTLLFGCQENRLAHKKFKKLSDEMLAWLSVWIEMQMISRFSSCCYCHPIISYYIEIQVCNLYVL